MQERWRSLAPEFPRHEVSDFGRVRNINKPDTYLVGTTLGKYRAVRISDQHGNPKTRCIHRLVALAFIPNPHNLPVVAHIDGRPLNNHYSNLRWATHKENAADRHAHGRTARGERHPRSRLTEQDVIMIRAIYDLGGTPLRDIARQFGVSVTTAHRAATRRSWKHVS